jgi:hypothetical protein
MVRHALTFDIITSPTYYNLLFSIRLHVAFGVMTFGVLERDKAGLRDGEPARSLECRTWKRLFWIYVRTSFIEHREQNYE